LHEARQQYESIVHKETIKDRERGLLWKILFYRNVLMQNMY
jgi:hypothetical protein